VDKSLLRQQELPDGDLRFHMLETIREFGMDTLGAEGEAAGVRERHAWYFLELAAEAGPQLRGAQQAQWMERLERDHDNIRSALLWLSREPAVGKEDPALRLVEALWWFWLVRGYWSEGREQIAHVLAQNPDGKVTKARANVQNGAACLAHCQGDYAAARALYEQALESMRGLNDERGVAALLGNLGIAALEQGDYAAARELQAEALERCRTLGNTRGVANALNNLGMAVDLLGDHEAAWSLYEEGLVLKRELGDRLGIANALYNLGRLALRREDTPTAARLLTEGVRTYHEIGDREGISLSLLALGRLLLLGRPDEAETARAVRLFGAADVLRAEIGAPIPPNALAEYEESVQAARSCLGEPRFSQEWAAGRALSLEATVELAAGTL